MSEPVVVKEARGRSLWQDAYFRFKKDKLAVVCLAIILSYCLVALLAKLGWLAGSWSEQVGPYYSEPSTESFATLFGTDYLGRSVLYKVIHGTRIAITVGLIASLISIPIGVIMGALAGYYGKWIDEFVVWLYTTMSSIPNIMLLMAITYSMGRGITSVYIALGLTSWVGLARVIRGEFIKHKSREYVLAADSLGASHFSRIFKHILPNVFHFVIINFSIEFVSAIKAEVILSFLGLGVQGQPSWGIMIDDAKMELQRGVWWQLAGATGGMFFLVLAFNVIGDALRDALDPKIK
jgi:ABC-type dipeptide/oligopeptide/nickel transport system permease subunit